MARRRIRARLGVYQRDGRLVWGRAPLITEEEWARVENPTRLRRLLAFLGLTYYPDRTRRTLLGGRTKD